MTLLTHLTLFAQYFLFTLAFVIAGIVLGALFWAMASHAFEVWK